MTGAAPGPGLGNIEIAGRHWRVSGLRPLYGVPGQCRERRVGVWVLGTRKDKTVTTGPVKIDTPFTRGPWVPEAGAVLRLGWSWLALDVWQSVWMEALGRWEQT